jgi:hypothetical protein
MPAPQLFAHYLERRRYFEIGFWILFAYVNAGANCITALIDLRRWPSRVAAWQVGAWELSSNTMLLVLVPVLLAFDHRWPLRWASWRRNLPRHLAFSVVFSLAHVSGMVLLRKAVYLAAGTSYEFGNWIVQWPYEYLKDVRTYFYILAFVYLYRLLLLRLQGEASLLAVPDEGPPVETIERPERFLVRKLGREFLIAVRDVEWLEASGNYVNLYARGHAYPLRSTMGWIEARLDPVRFLRVHRSYIVNLDQVAQIEPLDTGDARLVLRDGKQIPCSRRYREALRTGAAGAQSTQWSASR